MLAPGLIKDQEWVYLDIFIPMFLPKLDTKNQFEIITTKIPFRTKNFPSNSSDFNITNPDEGTIYPTDYSSITSTATPTTAQDAIRTTTREIFTTALMTTIQNILETNYTNLFNATNLTFNKTDGKARSIFNY